MINISILEDNDNDRSHIKELIEFSMKDMGLQCNISVFSEGTSFEESLNTHKYDICFFDIYLGGDKTGFDYATSLFSVDKDAKIIFLTDSEDFARMSYSVRAVHYLKKPAKTEDVLQALSFCDLQQRAIFPTLSIVSSGEELNISSKYISYIDYTDRKTTIHFVPGKGPTSEDEISVTMSFKDVTDPLEDDERFLLCFRGIYINMDYIIDQVGTDFITEGGSHVPITLRKKAQICQTYRQYVFTHME